MAPGETVKGFAGKASGQKSGKAGLVALLAVMSGIWVLSGCAGIADSQPPGPQAAVKITPATLSFSTPAVGQQAVQTATVTNTSSTPVSITSLSSSSSQFSTSGVTLPLSLAAGESARFQVAFRS